MAARIDLDQGQDLAPSSASRTVGDPDCSLCKAGCCGQHQRAVVDAQALALAALPQEPRPWDPRMRVRTPDGYRPPCLGRHGYGDGYLGDGTCDTRGRCEFAAQCFQTMKGAVARANPDGAAQFDGLHRDLTRELDGDGRAAMNVLVKQNAVPRPYEDAVRDYHLLGRLDSGKWAYCDTCPSVVRKERLIDGRCPRCTPEGG